MIIILIKERGAQLKKRIVRMTHQREIILEELRQLKTHPTADELYDIVKKRLPRISLATVYRNLDVLADLGMIQRIEVSGRQKRFDGNPEPHHHIRCLVCGRVADVEMDNPPKIDFDALHTHGFKVLGFRLEFEGVCPECSFTQKDSQSLPENLQ